MLQSQVRRSPSRQPGFETVVESQNKLPKGSATLFGSLIQAITSVLLESCSPLLAADCDILIVATAVIWVKPLKASDVQVRDFALSS